METLKDTKMNEDNIKQTRLLVNWLYNVITEYYMLDAHLGKASIKKKHLILWNFPEWEPDFQN